ncbi:MAG: FAD-dependent oxidoreductase [Candidatus Nanoarchaeia archaeon]|nr:FAD-dependent oxidoreductase [Candidatus Nanoarchaeia archaeon]
MYDLIIIGAGPAGCTAAIYAARYHLKTLVLYADMGQISYAHEIWNYPGYEQINGTELVRKMMAQAVKAGAELKQAEADSIKKKGKAFVVKAGGNEFESRAIILASGLKHKKLNIKGEKEFTGKGVSYCVTCDGPLFAEKDVVVIGASNSAVMAALMLNEYAKSVTILSRSQPSADASSLEIIKKSNKIKVLNGEPSEIKGDKFVNTIKLKNGKEIKAEGVFIEVGLEPSTELANQLKIKLEKSYIKADNEQKTNVKGIFAAGNITNRTSLKQIITAAGEGAIAANTAYNYLKGI